MAQTPHPHRGLGIIVVLFVFISVVGSLGGGGGGEESAKGGAVQEHNNSTSGGSASTDGLIVFRRYLDLEGTKSVIFTMYPNGSHIRPITHPPEGWGDDSPAWSPDWTKVAFHRGCLRSHCKGSRILLVDINTGYTRSVTHCIPNRGWTKEHPPPSSGHYCVRDSQPAFSADGTLIAFRRIIGPKDEVTAAHGSRVHAEHLAWRVRVVNIWVRSVQVRCRCVPLQRGRAGKPRRRSRESGVRSSSQRKC